MLGKIHIINKHHKSDTTNIKIFYIGRGSVLGNPYSHLDKTPPEFLCISREHAVQEYTVYFVKQFKENIEIRKYLKEMLNVLKTGTDIYLKCYCVPLACHGSVIKRVLENQITLIEKPKPI